MNKANEISQTIKLLDETIDIADKVAKNHLTTAYEQCVRDIEAQWRTMIQFSSLDDVPPPYCLISEKIYYGLLLLHIKSLKSYQAKIVDEYHKQQNDYRLERQRNIFTIICSIIGVIGVVVGVIISKF